MTLSSPIRNGVAQAGGGGGGSGGVAAPQEWATAYEKDFSSGAEVNLLTGGDGEKTIDGKAWELVNSSASTAVGVGTTSGGMKITANPASPYAFCHGGSPRTSAMMRVPLRELLFGSEAEGRDDIEIRISYFLTVGGGPSAYQFEGFAHGLDPKNNTAQSGGMWIWAGHWTNSPTRMRPIILGTDAGGPDEQTNTEVSVFPNAYRLLFRDGRLRKVERNSNATDTDLASVDWTPVKWALASTNEIFSLVEGAANELVFLFALDNYNGGGAFTSLTLKTLKVEWRPTLTAAALWLA